MLILLLPFGVVILIVAGLCDRDVRQVFASPREAWIGRRAGAGVVSDFSALNEG